MKEVMRALAEGRLREVFGSGTACQVCPVHAILYQGEVSSGCAGWGREGRSWASRRCLPQHLHIPTMENGPELVFRFQKELSAIQVRRWLGGGLGARSPEKPRSQEPPDWDSAPRPSSHEAIAASEPGPRAAVAQQPSRGSGTPSCQPAKPWPLP